MSFFANCSDFTVGEVHTHVRHGGTHIFTYNYGVPPRGEPMYGPPDAQHPSSQVGGHGGRRGGDLLAGLTQTSGNRRCGGENLPGAHSRLEQGPLSDTSYFGENLPDEDGQPDTEEQSQFHDGHQADNLLPGATPRPDTLPPTVGNARNPLTANATPDPEVTPQVVSRTEPETLDDTRTPPPTCDPPAHALPAMSDSRMEDSDTNISQARSPGCSHQVHEQEDLHQKHVGEDLPDEPPADRQVALPVALFTELDSGVITEPWKTASERISCSISFELPADASEQRSARVPDLSTGSGRIEIRVKFPKFEQGVTRAPLKLNAKSISGRIEVILPSSFCFTGTLIVQTTSGRIEVGGWDPARRSNMLSLSTVTGRIEVNGCRISGRTMGKATEYGATGDVVVLKNVSGRIEVKFVDG